MEMVAHEPFVNDPVAAAFDENGRLYVAEMRDYPYQPGPGEKPMGVVRLLEDTDGDGTLDQSHVFADQLLWPHRSDGLEGRGLRHRSPRHLVPQGHRR